MECVICNQAIKLDESVFLLRRVVCCGPEEYVYKLTVASDIITEVIHISCLGNSVVGQEAQCETTNEHFEEVSVVQRSDALSLFDE